MKTRLRIFGQRLASELTALRGLLGEVGARLEPLALDDLGRTPLGQARQVAGGLDALVSKLEDEQAYVVLFGPLKSGKSTLMNAIAGTWVSEVSPLPAYPCMVHVSHGERPRWTITRWNGTLFGANDARSVAAVLEEGHRELAAALRRVERSGQSFDPARDLPHSIKRIDVRVPAAALRGAGPILVDTPGLYSRMRFGYDRMAREFRDVAAGAIFVVKTDNLFLEQIFDEFEDLLGLFSRIFLIVNIDGSKRDLAPDGSIGPSLEAREPGRVIEAFETLAMSAELGRARDEGRLSIHAIDLLAAARCRLSQTAQGNAAADLAGNGHAPNETEARSGAGVPEAAEGGSGENGGLHASGASFDRFLVELTAYLDDSEHGRAFVVDGVRQARSHFAALRDLLGGEDLASLAVRTERLDLEREAALRRLEAAKRLREIDWEPHFARQREEVERLTRERTEPVQASSRSRAREELSRWLDDDRSFGAFLREGVVPVLVDAREQIGEAARDVACRVIGSDVSAAALRQEVGADLYEVDLPLSEIARETLAGLVLSSSRAEPAADLPARLVPVRRGVLDWLLLRSADRVRHSVLGPDDAPERPIPALVKRKRLAGAGLVLGQALEQRVGRFLAERLGSPTREIFGVHVAAVGRALRSALDRLIERESLAARDAAAHLEGLVQLREALSSLGAELEITRLRVDGLADEMGAPPVAVEVAVALSTTDEEIAVET